MHTGRREVKVARFPPERIGAGSHHADAPEGMTKIVIPEMDASLGLGIVGRDAGK